MRPRPETATRSALRPAQLGTQPPRALNQSFLEAVNPVLEGIVRAKLVGEADVASFERAATEILK